MSRGTDGGFLFLSERSLEGKDQIKLFLNLAQRQEEDHESTTDGSSLDFEILDHEDFLGDHILSSGPSLDGGERLDLDEFDELYEVTLTDSSDPSLSFSSGELLSPFLSEDEDEPSDGEEKPLQTLERLTRQLLSKDEVEALRAAQSLTLSQLHGTSLAASAATAAADSPFLCGVALQDVACTLASISPEVCPPRTPPMTPQPRALIRAGLLSPPQSSSEDLILEIAMASSGEESEIDIEDGEAPILLPRGRKRSRQFIEEEDDDDLSEAELDLGFDDEVLASLTWSLTAGLTTPQAPGLPLTPAGTPPFSPASSLSLSLSASPSRTPSRIPSPEPLLIDADDDEVPERQPRAPQPRTRRSQPPSASPKPSEDGQGQGRRSRVRREREAPSTPSLKNGTSPSPLHTATSKPLPSTYFSKPTSLAITPSRSRKRRAWEQEDSDSEIDILGI